jgi:hypothetical protein
MKILIMQLARRLLKDILPIDDVAEQEEEVDHVKELFRNLYATYR